MKYVLVIFMFTGYGDTRSVAINNVNDFYTKELCEEARRKVKEELTVGKYAESYLRKYEHKLICVRTK